MNCGHVATVKNPFSKSAHTKLATLKCAEYSLLLLIQILLVTSSLYYACCTMPVMLAAFLQCIYDTQCYNTYTHPHMHTFQCWAPSGCIACWVLKTQQFILDYHSIFSWSCQEPSCKIFCFKYFIALVWMNKWLVFLSQCEG